MANVADILLQGVELESELAKRYLNALADEDYFTAGCMAFKLVELYELKIKFVKEQIELYQSKHAKKRGLK